MVSSEICEKDRRVCRGRPSSDRAPSKVDKPAMAIS